MPEIDGTRWQHVLMLCGVKPLKAAEWGPVFALQCQPEKFSQGGREIDDFLGQVLHETTMLRALEEGLSYSPERIREIAAASKPGSRWRSLGPRADELARRPERMAEAAYGGRMGNGPEGSGDGWKFRGSGIPMVTGRDNYAYLEKLTGLKLTQHPELLRQPVTALMAGILWWEGKVPDSAIDSLERVTRAVNGGLIGLDDRAALTAKARKALAPYVETR